MPSFKQAFPKVRASGVAFVVSGLLTSTTIFAQNTYSEAPNTTNVADHPLDGVFAQLRDAARKNDVNRADQLADQLGSYPLTSYVAYYRLKPRLFNSNGTPNTNAPDAAIMQFINTYKTEHPALVDRMRNDYALVLGERRDWGNFRTMYAQFELKDDMQLKCYEQMANLADGTNVIAATKALLSESKYANVRSCQQLLNQLSDSGKLSAENRNYFAALAAYNSNAQGQALANGNAATARMASLVNQANNDKGGLASNLPTDNSQTSALAQAYYGYSASRQARSDAATYYRNAYQQYKQLDLPDDVLGWQARAGMRSGDWQLVATAIDRMTHDEQNTSVWQYWRGRAYAAQGDKTSAAAQYRQAASSIDFYGILSKEELGQKVSLPPAAAPSTKEEINVAARNQGFERARKFKALNMILEYNREWNFPLRGMNDRQLLASAEYAHKIGFLDRMINTSDRTQSEFNFKQRYPTPYLNIMNRRAADAGITPAWAYGIIRQESRFVTFAQSSANANGLMQIIPGTARLVARRIGLTNFTDNQIYDIDTNIQLGTAYLGQTRDQLGGSLPLASAGYNAGPGRPPQWRRTLSRSVDGAIYAETIPFSETRDYVKNVMSNMVYYHLMLDGSAPSLKNVMSTVSP